MPDTNLLAKQLDRLFAEYQQRVDHAVAVGENDAVPKLTAMYDTAALELVGGAVSAPQIPAPRSPESDDASLGRRALRRLSPTQLRD